MSCESTRVASVRLCIKIHVRRMSKHSSGPCCHVVDYFDFISMVR